MFLIHTLVDFEHSFAWMKLNKVLFNLLGDFNGKDVDDRDGAECQTNAETD